MEINRIGNKMAKMSFWDVTRVGIHKSNRTMMGKTGTTRHRHI